MVFWTFCWPSVYSRAGREDSRKGRLGEHEVVDMKNRGEISADKHYCQWKVLTLAPPVLSVRVRLLGSGFVLQAAFRLPHPSTHSRSFSKPWRTRTSNCG